MVTMKKTDSHRNRKLGSQQRKRLQNSSKDTPRRIADCSATLPSSPHGWHDTEMRVFRDGRQFPPADCTITRYRHPDNAWIRDHLRERNFRLCKTDPLPVLRFGYFLSIDSRHTFNQSFFETRVKYRFYKSLSQRGVVLSALKSAFILAVEEARAPDCKTQYQSRERFLQLFSSSDEDLDTVTQNEAVYYRKCRLEKLLQICKREEKMRRKEESDTGWKLIKFAEAIILHSAQRQAVWKEIGMACWPQILADDGELSLEWVKMGNLDEPTQLLGQMLTKWDAKFKGKWGGDCYTRADADNKDFKSTPMRLLGLPIDVWNGLLSKWGGDVQTLEQEYNCGIVITEGGEVDIEWERLKLEEKCKQELAERTRVRKKRDDCEHYPSKLPEIEKAEVSDFMDIIVNNLMAHLTLKDELDDGLMDILELGDNIESLQVGSVSHRSLQGGESSASNKPKKYFSNSGAKSAAQKAFSKHHHSSRQPTSKNASHTTVEQSIDDKTIASEVASYEDVSVSFRKARKSILYGNEVEDQGHHATASENSARGQQALHQTENDQESKLKAEFCIVPQKGGPRPTAADWC